MRANLFVKLDDYFRWRLGLAYSEGPFVLMAASLFKVYLWLGGHPAKVTANIGMRDGVVWNKEFHAAIETYGHPIGWSGDFRTEFTLFASAYSVSRFEGHGGVDPQLMLHPHYMIGARNCTICVLGWAIFTPYAASEDVHRLMQMDLSCLTSWRRCLTQSDIMPIAWAQHLAELPTSDRVLAPLVCAPSTLEILGRDSPNIAVVEVRLSRSSR